MRIKKVYVQYFLAPFLPMYVEGGGGLAALQSKWRDSVQPLKKPTKMPPIDLVPSLTKA
jgi:hypothetical protein